MKDGGNSIENYNTNWYTIDVAQCIFYDSNMLMVVEYTCHYYRGLPIRVTV